MDLMDHTYHMLEVYRSRLLAIKQNPCGSTLDMIFYEKEIDKLEAEVAFLELMKSLEPTKPETIETDCWQVVEELCRTEKVIFMKIKWSWTQFKFLWSVQYINANRKCYS